MNFFAFWVALGALAAASDTLFNEDPHALSTALYSSATIVLGVTMFWRHGGNVITSAGVYSLASAVFVGFAGIYYLSQPEPISSAVYIGVTTGYWVTVLLTAFWPQVSFQESSEMVAPEAGWLMLASLAAVCATLVLVTAFNEVSGAVPVHITLGGMTVLLLAGMLYRTTRPVIRAIFLGVPLLWIFVTTVFTGYGRLSLVSLVLAAAILASLRARGRGAKALVLGGAIPALLIMIRMRERFGVQEYGQELSGIGSVVTPVRDFGRLVLALRSTNVEHGGLDPFIAGAVFWVPRAIWPEKPVGFGSTLTQILEPQLVSIGQSLAALNQGEFFYAWGWVGVAVGVVLTGLYVRLLDRSLLDAAQAGAASRSRLLLLCALIVVISDLPNLVWAGSYGHVTRIVLRLVPLLMLIPFMRVRKPTTSRYRGPALSGR